MLANVRAVPYVEISHFCKKNKIKIIIMMYDNAVMTLADKPH